MAGLTITNRQARWLWLEVQGLSETPVGTLDLRSLIKRLGFVQLDTIQVVARAHHHTIWSRNQNYREPMLNRLLQQDRAVFEHFTHDASILPIEFYPMWTRQFRRMTGKIDSANWYKGLPDAHGRAEIKDRIAREGPLSTHDFDSSFQRKGHMWQRPPHKLALDYMWYGGELATAHRRNFIKFYDVSERVIPESIRGENMADVDQVDWLCRNALDRLGFASAGDIQRFWDAVDAAEVRSWVTDYQDELTDVSIVSSDGSVIKALAWKNIEAQLARLKPPTKRLRILNPFDPAIRDRSRLKRLFDLDYRIEIFVPAAKRLWGYYVFPILEGDRFVGRIEARADRGEGVLNVCRLWSEPGVFWTSARAGKLEAELTRMARFVGLERVQWACPARPETR